MLSERVKYSRYNKHSSEHIKHLQLPGQCIVLLFTQSINVLFHFLSRWGGGGHSQLEQDTIYVKKVMTEFG